MAGGDALQYLFSLEKRGIHLDLGPVSELLGSLGNPQNAYRTVHVAGTNGKGSVAAMLASILLCAGYRVGLYTSPHLVDFRERIRVDGAMISEEALIKLVERVRDHVTEEITFFECTTALAFLHFQQMSVDIAVIEVGMGGRLDATNCITPDLSIITNISVEHEEFLGKRLTQIAAEKGGIIKENGLCISGARQDSVRTVLAEIAEKRHARIFFYGDLFSVRYHKNRKFSYDGMDRSLKNLMLPLAGRHQAINAALALAATEFLSRNGRYITDNAMSEGIAATKWEGRLEVIGQHPLVVVDGAHNPAGVRALFQSLGEEFTWNRLIVVFGVMSDKRHRAMLSVIASRAHRIILTCPDIARARRLTHASIRDMGFDPDLFEIIPDPREAFARARSLAGEKDLLLATGSLYLVGEVKRLAVTV